MHSVMGEYLNDMIYFRKKFKEIQEQLNALERKSENLEQQMKNIQQTTDNINETLELLKECAKIAFPDSYNLSEISLKEHSDSEDPWKVW